MVAVQLFTAFIYSPVKMNLSILLIKSIVDLSKKFIYKNQFT